MGKTNKKTRRIKKKDKQLSEWHMTRIKNRNRRYRERYKEQQTKRKYNRRILGNYFLTNLVDRLWYGKKYVPLPMANP